MKFGGSSVADAGRIHSVADIILSRIKIDGVPPVVVVSAMKGVTDTLIAAAAAAESGDTSYKTTLAGLRQKHHEAVKALITDNSIGTALQAEMDFILDELGEILHGVELVRECSLRTNDLISGFGERLSSLLVAAHRGGGQGTGA